MKEDQATRKADDDYRNVARFYDEVYYRGAGEPAESRVPWHARALADRLALRGGERILDVACGTGDWLQVAAARGLEVAGIDISERAIEICRTRMPAGEFRVGPAERLGFLDRAFDVVTCLGSLEHFLDQPAALAEMTRVLKPDGRIVILVPNAGFLPYRLGLYRGTQQQAVRETIRPLNEWSAMFGASGLDVLSRWRDLHILDRRWIARRPWWMALPRLAVAAALPCWPLSWQYQVFHLCRIHRGEAMPPAAQPATLQRNMR